MGRFFTLFSILFVLPTQAFAGVFVSEVAWMGTVTSASNEWVELYNDTDMAVDLTGWTLKSKDGSPSIALQGTIPPKAYFLIERTDDDTVPEITADLVTTFGKGISNEGETLDLKDSSGLVVDTVKGGKDWKNIGGDAKTKFTPQKRGSVWITAKGTPRAAPPVAQVLPPPPTPVLVAQSEEKKIPTQTVISIPTKMEQSVVPKKEEAPTVAVVQPELQKVYSEEVDSDTGSQEASSTAPLLGALLLAGSGVVVYLRGKTKTEAEKYEIIEDETDEKA